MDKDAINSVSKLVDAIDRLSKTVSEQTKKIEIQNREIIALKEVLRARL